uniref:sugar phosphate isomerase/epimerase family protein n=1 Tax=Deinococcus sp. TaxID=47478 RepID=UPI0025BE8D92
MNDLKRLGLALLHPELEKHADWLSAEGRDIELQDLCESCDLMEGDWHTLAREQARLLQHHRGRIGVHAPFLNMQLAAADPRIRRVVQERYFQGLDFAQAVGGQWLVIHSPFHFWGGLTTAHRASLAQEMAVAQLTLEPVLERAASQGVSLVIENITDRDTGPLLELVRSFDSPHVRLSVDVGHAHVGAVSGGGLSAHGWLSQGSELL